MDDRRLISFLKLLVFGPTPEQKKWIEEAKQEMDKAEREVLAFEEELREMERSIRF